MILLKFVGSKLGQMIVVALVVGLILFTAIQYIQSVERDKIQIETLQNNVERRERADENVKQIRRDNPTGDGAVALEQLRSRQSGR